MAESYDGTEGDDALAAGFDVMDGGEDRRDGWLAINKTRDMIAQRTSAVTPIAKGGTGAANAASARANLGAASADHTHDSGDIDYSGIGSASSPPNVYRSVDGSLRVTGYDLASASNLTGGTLSRPVSTTGGLRAQSVRDNVVSGWYNVGVSSNGTLGQTASARRFKQHIEDLEHAGDIDRLQPRRFEWRAGDVPDIGLIAEEVEEAGYTDLVTHNTEGTIMGVRYEMLPVILLAEIQKLRARVAELEAQR